jgi:hypothetical protein
MRVLLTLLLSTLVALTVAIPPAASKEGGTIQVTGIPEQIRAKQPVDVTITLQLEGGVPWDIVGVRPGITIRNESTHAERNFYAEPTASTGVYRVRIFFPRKAGYFVTAWTDLKNRDMPRAIVQRRVGPAGGRGVLVPLLAAAAVAVAVPVGVVIGRR